MNPEKIQIKLIAHPEDEAVEDAFQECRESTLVREIIEAKESNLWKWCIIELRATYGPFSGSSYLGGCSYESGEDFKAANDYYDDMVQDAVMELQKEIETYRATIERFDRLGPQPFYTGAREYWERTGVLDPIIIG